jgi:hypothetical protein
MGPDAKSDVCNHETISRFHIGGQLLICHSANAAIQAFRLGIPWNVLANTAVVFSASIVG